jgi:hypothetical protein
VCVFIHICIYRYRIPDVGEAFGLGGSENEPTVIRRVRTVSMGKVRESLSSSPAAPAKKPPTATCATLYIILYIDISY